MCPSKHNEINSQHTSFISSNRRSWNGRVFQDEKARKGGWAYELLCCKNSRLQLNWSEDQKARKGGWTYKLLCCKKTWTWRPVASDLLLIMVHINTAYTRFTHFCCIFFCRDYALLGGTFCSNLVGRGTKTFYTTGQWTMDSGPI